MNEESKKQRVKRRKYSAEFKVCEDSKTITTNF